jgi:ornithine cyclodeaminase/alanine dehydrogenase-like protein (mu-crystallin family)
VQIFNEDQVRRCLSYEKLIPALEQALIRFSQGDLRQPVRTVLPVPEHHGLFGLMPAVDGDLMGIKLVTVFEKNLVLPTHQAVIQLFSASSGEPLATMDGRLITEMRTAAVSAIATRLLARPGARSLAILGSGVQARAHLRALRTVGSFPEVRIWSRTPEHARRFAAECGGKATSLEEAIRGADVVVGVSNVAEPLTGESPIWEPPIRGEYLAEHAFVAAVGAIGPGKRELDDRALDAHIVVESRAAALKESGDILASNAPIYAELGQLLAGDIPLPSGKRVVYKSLGIAAEDLAAARIVYEAAL